MVIRTCQGTRAPPGLPGISIEPAQLFDQQAFRTGGYGQGGVGFVPLEGFNGSVIESNVTVFGCNG